jgi:hypothetical protein
MKNTIPELALVVLIGPSGSGRSIGGLYWYRYGEEVWTGWCASYHVK